MSDITLESGEALCPCGMRYFYNARSCCPFCGVSAAERNAIGPTVVRLYRLPRTAQERLIARTAYRRGLGEGARGMVNHNADTPYEEPSASQPIKGAP